MNVSNKKVLLIIGVFFVLLLLVLFIVINSLKSKTKSLSGTSSVTPTQSSSQPQINNQNSIFPSPTEGVGQPQKVLPFPKAEFASWSLPPSPSYLPASAAIYNLKQTYTQDEVLSLAKKLSLSGTIEKFNDNLLISSIDKVNNQNSNLIFNTKTNNFAYLSTKGISLPTTLGTTTVQEKVSLFLKNLFFDPTLSVTASYKKNDKPDITYFEIHRSWQETGLPILNSIGLLNLPEDQLLSSLSLIGKVNNTPQDPKIYQSSDNKDGLARQSDFNTITIGVQDKEGKIISLSSNLRKIETNKLTLTFLVSFDQAYLRLKNNQFESLLTTPSGAGVTSFEKVYPENKAIAKNATITESFVAYLEKPSTAVQTTLDPYYIFRGYANLDSGYRVNFIATVPASETKTVNQVVLGVTAAEIGGQQQDDLSLPTITPTPTPAPTTPPSNNCNPSVSQLTNIHEVNGVTIGNNGNWYLIPKGDCNTAECLTQVLAALQGNISGFRNISRILSELLSKPSCPIRITGGSPTIFIYGKKDTRAIIIPKAILTYSDPAVDDNNLWEIQVKNDGSLEINQRQYSYLYYEYQPIKFNKPEKGWLIEKNNLKQLANTISSQLKLNNKENERLIFELNFAASDIKGNYFFVGLVNQEELNQKLPLTITPNPDKIYRYHFYIGEAKGQRQIQPPLLLPIERVPFIILELGAVGNK